jgi:hypothetical protein
VIAIHENLSFLAVIPKLAIIAGVLTILQLAAMVGSINLTLAGTKQTRVNKFW